MLLTRIISFLMAVWSILLSYSGANAPLGKKAESFRVTTYVVASYTQDINAFCYEDFDIITDAILFGCAVFDENGDITVDENMLENSLRNLHTVIDGREVNISINLLGPQKYGDSTVYEEQMAYQAELHSNAFRSGKLEKKIKELAEKYDLDGVHFDYEYPISLKAWTDFNNFLTDLRKEMPDRLIGVAVSDWDMKLSTKAMAAVDTVELMLYDNYDEKGRHSTYETCVSSARKTALKGLPLEKVNFGLPFYARPTDHGAFWYDYKSYAGKLDCNNFYYDSSNDKTFWFNTPDVISEKTQFAVDNGFGGVMIWHYTCDLPSTDEKSLLRAIGQTINN